MKQLTIDVQVRPKQYAIYIGAGVVRDMIRDLTEHPLAKRYAMIADSTVAALHGERIASAMREAGLAVKLYTFPAGEESKNRETKNRLEDMLLEDHLGRDSAVLALGGGVTGDMAGFVAANYMRGVPLIQIPTTTLAQIDSSIGGKTAVDTPQGKNLLGAFYHPKAIYMDMELLATLDERNYRAGLVELVKMALMDPPLLDYYMENADIILARTGERYYPVMEELLSLNCGFKNRVVQQDDTESNLRKVLNYGHTFGHAVELLSHFSVIHGEAVAIGIRFAAYLSGRLGLMREEEVLLENRLMDGLGMPETVPGNLTPSLVMEVMSMDKKAREGKAEFILLEGVGRIHRTEDGGYASPVPTAFLAECVEDFLRGKRGLA